MQSQKLNHSGFTAIETMLGFIIIILIAFVGYYVYHTQSQSNKTLNNATQVATSSPSKSTKKTSSTPASPTKYFTITEWGVRAPYSGNLTLEYNSVTNGANDAGHPLVYARLSSVQLDASASICKSGGDYGGIISRYHSSDEYLVGDSSVASGKTAAQYAATLTGADYGHVGDYYYFRNGPQAACGDSSASQDLQSQTAKAFINLLPKLQAIP